MNLNKLIKELRKSHNLTQEDVAKKLSIATSTYGGYEQGTSEPSIEILIKMADFFDVSLDYLCGRVWNNKIGYIPDNATNIVKNLINLKDLELEKVNAYVTAIIDTRQ